MAKSIDLHLDDESENLINIILANTDDFESQANCIRVSIKKHLKATYPELLYDKLKNDQEEE